MESPVRVKPQEARDRVKTGGTILVCAYDSDEKFAVFHLEGAQSLSNFESLLPSLSKEQEIIFYCA